MPDLTLVGIPAIRDDIKKLGAIYEASLKWRWRFLAIIVAVASVISAIFQVLNFFMTNS